MSIQNNAHIDYEAVIGLEIHVQLATQSKLFCPAPAYDSLAPNTHVSPVSLALPGALPVLNQLAVRYAVMAGIALNCTIQQNSVFARKNYTYPDLPKGYQISQYEDPLCLDGYINITYKKIGITRIHMEEDAGKLRHRGSAGLAGSSGSDVDLNRAGIPLIEIVSEPDIRTAQEAREYMEKIHEIVSFIGICDGNLEAGSFRCDANVSLRPTGTLKFGTRTETKNLNSFKAIETAVAYEIDRQTTCLNQGGRIRQETRHYDDATGKTIALRTKEDANDYRYFPDPDLPALSLSDAYIKHIRQTMPDLPDTVRETYAQAGVSAHAINTLIQDKVLYQRFKTLESQCKHAPVSLIATWLTGPVQAVLKAGHTLDLAILAQALDACHTEKLSPQMLKAALADYGTQDFAKWLATAQASTATALDIDQLVQDSIKTHPDVVKKIQSGKTAAVNVLIGHVMKHSKGRAKPDEVRDRILNACEHAL